MKTPGCVFWRRAREARSENLRKREEDGGRGRKREEVRRGEEKCKSETGGKGLYY